MVPVKLTFQTGGNKIKIPKIKKILVTDSAEFRIIDNKVRHKSLQTINSQFAELRPMILVANLANYDGYEYIIMVVMNP